MALPLTLPPATLCILRLSAVGDVCHTLPIVRTLQLVWPDTKLTWIIGKLEHTLVGDIPGIEFIIFDKAKGLHAYRELHHHMKGRHFDVLLHMQMSLRASLASLLIPATIRLGFDKQRATDLQWLFTNARIAHIPNQHVMESFFGFLEALGIQEKRLEWNIPVPATAFEEVKSLLPPQPFMVISPCSSMAYRNWHVEAYADVIDYMADNYQLPTVLTGGPSAIEREYGEKISQLCKHKPVNLIGKTSLKQLLAILQQAKVLVAPDSGPAHMATAVGTPVIGLYATTNPDRARPYLNPEFVVNRYPEAVYEKYKKSVNEVPWGTRIRDPQTMERIRVEDVTAKLDQIITADLAR
jgi:heptosyltransferase I